MVDQEHRMMWGTDIVGRQEPPAFMQYSPRHARLPDLFAECGRWGDRIYLVQGSRRLSYSETLDRVDALAAHLRARGAQAKDRIILMAPNSPEWVITFWAAHLLGACLVLGNGWWSDEELSHALRSAAPVFAVADVQTAKRLGAVPVVLTSEIQGLATSANAAGAESSLSEDEPALVVYTSGTSGLPKGVVLSHRSVIANVHNFVATLARSSNVAPTTTRVNLLCGPLFHIGGVQSMVLGAVTGRSLVFLEGKFESTEVLDLIERERVEIWGAVPTMATRVLRDPSLSRRDLTSVTSISLGGAPVTPSLVSQLRTAFPNAQRGVSTIYGLTETGGTVTSASGRLMAEHPGTSGRPLPVVELRIADEDPDGDGEVLVRTPGQMSEYLAEPEASRIVDPEGWVHTGDIGRLENGLLYITGRSKDVIIRGGENVSASRVESVLASHRAVDTVAVVGLPDDDLGESVGAVVILAEAHLVDVETLRCYVTERLAHFEVPSRWWIRTEALPLNGVGKVDKPTLVASWIARRAN
jgi:long-chain acyl-CoA synthetase